MKTVRRLWRNTVAENITGGVWAMFGVAVIAFVVMTGCLVVSAPAPDPFLTITFTAPGDDGDVGTASEYLVYFSPTEFDGGNVDSLVDAGIVDTAHFCASPNVAGTAEQCALIGLVGEVTYYVAIRAADEVPNWSELSNVVSATVPDGTPPTRIVDLQIFVGGP